VAQAAAGGLGAVAEMESRLAEVGVAELIVARPIQALEDLAA